MDNLKHLLYEFWKDEYGGIVSAIVGVVSGFAQARAAKKAADAQREQNNIATAAEKNKNAAARRRALREARIRQSQVQQASVNSGVTYSSGELGALAAISTNTSAAIGEQGADVLTSEGITRQSNIEAKAISTAKRWGAISSIFQSLDDFSKQL